MPSTRSYRRHSHPKDRDGYPTPCDSGVVQIRARDAENAQRIAHQITGCSISGVERLKAAAA